MVINHLQVLAWSSKWFRHGNQEVEVGVFHEVKIAGKVYERSGSWGMDAQGSWGGTGWTSVGSDMLGLLGWLEDTSTKRWSTFFFVGAKKFTTENNKSDGKFLGEPQAKFRGGYWSLYWSSYSEYFFGTLFLMAGKETLPPKIVPAFVFLDTCAECDKRGFGGQLKTHTFWILIRNRVFGRCCFTPRVRLLTISAIFHQQSPSNMWIIKKHPKSRPYENPYV